jgi:alcohol dehydrogenase
MLFDNAKLTAGQWILVQAGGSGIGTAAIQLAKGAGATVITTVGSVDKADKARALGADHVINYREDRFEGVVRKLTRKEGVDVVFEHVGPDTFAASMFCLKRGGTLVTCGSTTGVSAEINLFQLYQRQLRLIGSFGCNLRNLRDSLQKMADGIAVPVIDSTITIDQIDAALTRLESRNVFGKIIVTL